MKVFFIVSTSEFSTGFFVHSKYDQLPQMYTFKTTKLAKEFAEIKNKEANIDYEKYKVELSENKDFSLGVKEFITNY